jgi:hypothetical protein
MCVTQGGRRRVFETYIHTVSMHYSMHSFFMAWRLPAWHGTHPYGSVAFLLFLLSLF